jgi:hypothetical protein
VLVTLASRSRVAELGASRLLKKLPREAITTS